MVTIPPALAPARRGRSDEVFVGRRAEVDDIVLALDDAARGEPRIVRVEGGPGMGKTSLLTRALSRCLDRPGGASVLRGGGDPAELDLAYGLLDQLVGEVDADVLDRFPLARAGRDPRVDPMAVGADLLGVLGALSAVRPALLVIDDAQWADALSARAVAFALRRLRHDRVLVVLGVRGPEGAAVPAVDRAPTTDPWWERVSTGSGSMHRLALRGLDPTELSELAAALGSPLGATGAAERLWRHTLGHPLHARTLIEELPPEVLAATGDVLPAPSSLSSVVLVRLSRATPQAQGLTVAAAVLGETCPLARAAVLAGLADPSAALDDAVRVGLLEERADSPVVRIGFVHPLLRAAVYGDLPPTRRRALHRAAASLVSGRAALTHRVAAAAGPDPDLAAELEALATDATSGVGAGEAADLLRAAADLDTASEDRERHLFEAADTLLTHGEVRRAAALEAELAACRPGPRRSELLGRAALFTGRLGRARVQLDAAQEQAESQARTGAAADGTAARVRAHRALLHLLEGAPGRAVTLATAAVADGGHDAQVRRVGGFALILGLGAEGRPAEARAVLDLVSGPPDARTPLYPDVLAVRGVLAALADDDVVAGEALDEAVRRGRAGEPVRTLALATAFRAAVADRTGVPGAVAGLEVAVAAARDGGMTFAETVAHGLAAQVLAVRGHDAAARAHLGAALGDGSAWWGAVLSTSIAGGVVALAADDPPGMLAALEPVLRPDALALADGLGSLAPRALHVEALLRTGDHLAASTAAAALGERLVGRPPGRGSLDAARLRGLLAEAAGRPDAARAALEEGLATAATVRAPVAVARLETELGRLLLTTGERRAGVDALRTARDRLRGAGAVAFLDRTERLLHDAGLTPAAGREALGLTVHEEAVVALVVRGLSNREVGRDLFVTPRTVAYHLSNVYAKLGVTSRRELRDRLAAP